jgi:hypothetical protein
MHQFNGNFRSSTCNWAWIWTPKPTSCNSLTLLYSTSFFGLNLKLKPYNCDIYISTVDQGSIFHGGNIRRSADTCNFVVCGTSGSSCPYEINNVLKDNWTHKWQHGRPQPDTEAHENSTATVPSHRERSATRIDTTVRTKRLTKCSILLCSFLGVNSWNYLYV